jgi:hypothetical protein
MAKVVPYTHPKIIGDLHYKEEDSFLLSPLKLNEN